MPTRVLVPSGVLGLGFDRAALAQRRPVGVRLAAELLEGDLPAD